MAANRSQVISKCLILRAKINKICGDISLFAKNWQGEIDEIYQ